MKRSTIPHNKLNALVHVHVFQGDFTRACGGAPDSEGFCSWCRQIVIPGRPHAIVITTPNYAGDIRDAWRIVEHYSDVQMHYMEPGTNRYGGTNMAVINKYHRGLGDTMAKALCWAALDVENVAIEE